MGYQVAFVRAFKDNYIWIIHNDKVAVVVDPGDAAAVAKFLHENSLKLVAILLTHEHSDHNAGMMALKQLSPDLRLIGCGFADYSDYEKILLAELDLSIAVINTPGHTSHHVIFLINETHLFCGDVLFSLGCGRVFTGDYHSAYNSLQKIKRLSTDILVYPAHEYTETNLHFTLSIDNDLEYYCEMKNTINSRLQLFGNSLPTKLGDELKYNLFLRTDETKVCQLIANACGDFVYTDCLDCFVALRELRNNF